MIINPGNLIITEAKGRGECKISNVNISNQYQKYTVYHMQKKITNKHHCTKKRLMEL